MDIGGGYYPGSKIRVVKVFNDMLAWLSYLFWQPDEGRL